jgi:hypothetical protein
VAGAVVLEDMKLLQAVFLVALVAVVVQGVV